MSVERGLMVANRSFVYLYIYSFVYCDEYTNTNTNTIIYNTCSKPDEYSH